jgi:predicted small lipoprotein YifL
LYGAARIGDLIVNRRYSRGFSGSAIILLSAAVLALGGCGRKGALDLPPHDQTKQSAATPAQPVAAAPTDSVADEAAKPSVFNPYYGTDAPPTAAKGTKKAFILDPLLDSH